MPITPWEGWPHLLLHTKMFCNWWMLPPFGADLFDISFSYGRLISTWPSANSLRAYRVNTKKIDTLPCSKFDFNLLVKPRSFIGAREKISLVTCSVTNLQLTKVPNICRSHSSSRSAPFWQPDSSLARASSSSVVRAGARDWPGDETMLCLFGRCLVGKMVNIYGTWGFNMV